MDDDVTARNAAGADRRDAPVAEPAPRHAALGGALARASAGRAGRRALPRPAAGSSLAVEAVQAHAASMLRVARRHSLCADDAHDAYQRTLEIYLRHVDTVDPASTGGWLRTVVRREALAVRAERMRVVCAGDGAIEARADDRLATPDEQAERFDRLAHAAEALQRLKPAEVRALALKANGLSYAEIAAATGWSYTKVNRCLAEGRQALRERLARIEDGRECERWAGVLSALADGEASTEDVLAVRPHLRRCAGCRATLRAYREAPRRVAAVAPATLVLAAAPADAPLGGAVRAVEAALGSVGDRAAASAVRAQAAWEAVTTGKAAAVAASAVAIAGGGGAVAVQHASSPRPESAAGRQAAAPVGGGSGRASDPAPGAPAWSPRADPAQSGRPRDGQAAARPHPDTPPTVEGRSAPGAAAAGDGGEFGPEAGNAPVDAAPPAAHPAPADASAGSGSASAPAPSPPSPAAPSQSTTPPASSGAGGEFSP